MALNEWLRVKYHLLAGRPRPPKVGPDTVDLAKLTNEFLHHKKQRVESGERSNRTWLSYKAVGEVLVAFFGRNQLPEYLRPDDFQRFRTHLAKQFGPVSLGNRIQVVRMIFKYGYIKGCFQSRPTLAASSINRTRRRCVVCVTRRGIRRSQRRRFRR